MRLSEQHTHATLVFDVRTARRTNEQPQGPAEAISKTIIFCGRVSSSPRFTYFITSFRSLCSASSTSERYVQTMDMGFEPINSTANIDSTIRPLSTVSGKGGRIGACAMRRMCCFHRLRAREFTVSLVYSGPTPCKIL